MPSRPWYKWYPGDWIADTRMLSLEEKGAYRELLDAIWLQGPIEFSPRFLGRLLGIHGNSARRFMRVLGPFFTHENGRITHEKLERQRVEVTEKRENARRAGRKGGVANAEATRARARAHPPAGPDPEPDKDLNPRKDISWVKGSTTRANGDGNERRSNLADPDQAAEAERLQAQLEQRRRDSEVGVSGPRPAAVTAIAALAGSAAGLEKGEKSD